MKSPQHDDPDCDRIGAAVMESGNVNSLEIKALRIVEHWPTRFYYKALQFFREQNPILKSQDYEVAYFCSSLLSGKDATYDCRDSPDNHKVAILSAMILRIVSSCFVKLSQARVSNLEKIFKRICTPDSQGFLIIPGWESTDGGAPFLFTGDIMNLKCRDANRLFRVSFQLQAMCQDVSNYQKAIRWC